MIRPRTDRDEWGFYIAQARSRFRTVELFCKYPAVSRVGSFFSVAWHHSMFRRVLVTPSPVLSDEVGVWQMPGPGVPKVRNLAWTTALRDPPLTHVNNTLVMTLPGTYERPYRNAPYMLSLPETGRPHRPEEPPP